MQFIRGTLIASAALVVGGVTAAQAADLNYGGSIKDGYVAPMAAPAPSVYFRIDGGYAFHDEPRMTENTIYTLTDVTMDEAWTFGGGVGMYFSKNVRADITVDHRFEHDLSGNLADHAATLEGVRHFGLASTVGLVNVYYDFDMGRNFTPYVGAGLGFVRHTTKEGTVTDPCGTCTAVIEGDSQTHVAAALMAGFSMTLRDRLMLDAGYRFLYLGEAATGPVRFTGTAPGAPSVSDDPIAHDIHAHEFRVGLRYNVR